ncbi:hypothetical protein GYH30_014791 [Glycine max]|nr:hypothetical protein GYH30_014791 [Glycine max]
MCRRRCACPECVVGWDVDDVRLDDDGAHSGAGVEVGDRAVVGVAMVTANHAETEDVALVVEDMRRLSKRRTTDHTVEAGALISCTTAGHHWCEDTTWMWWRATACQNNRGR